MIYTKDAEFSFDKANRLIEDSIRPTKTFFGKVEYTKKGKGGLYGVIKEQGNYTIKINNRNDSANLAENFTYIDSFETRKKYQRKTLQEAIKYVNLLINEEKYVVDVPVARSEEADVPEMPSMPTGDMPMDSGDTAAMDGEDMGLGGEDGAVDEKTANEDQEEMQSMTGKLAQNLRQEIGDGNETFTVGMFKSILAAAKGLSPENKEKIAAKAEEVLNVENESENAGEDQPIQQESIVVERTTVGAFKKMLKEHYKK